MKTRLLIVISLVAFGSAKALPEDQTLANTKPGASQPDNAPQAQVIAELPIEKYLSSAQDQQDLIANSSYHEASRDQALVSVIKKPDGSSELLLKRTGSTGLCRTALLSVPQNLVRQITETRYGITGEVSYSLAGSNLNLDRGALDIASVYSQFGLNAPIDRWYTKLQGPVWGAQSENMGLMEGTRDWGTFYLGFDRRYADRRPNAELTFKKIIFNVLLDGAGTVHLRNLKLVQYPDAPAPTATNPPQPSGTSPATTLPEGKLTTYLLWWPGAVESRNHPPETILTASEKTASWLRISHTVETPLDLPRLDAGFLSPEQSFSNIIPTPRRYGLMGQIEYEDVAAGSYLELTSNFMDSAKSHENPYKAYNSRVSIEGSSSGREFTLPVDSTKIPGVLTGLSFNIHLAGRGKMTLRDVRMVRYDDPLPSSAAPTDPPVVGAIAPSSPPSLAQVGEQVGQLEKNALKAIWFCVGVVATCLCLLLIGALTVLWKRLRKRNRERELRRIASLDG